MDPKRADQRAGTVHLKLTEVIMGPERAIIRALSSESLIYTHFLFLA